MNPVVAVIAPGQMGSAVGKRLADSGITVLTDLENRSTETAQRAETAGMKGATLQDIAQADIILSIVPPGEAVNLARRLAPVLSAATRKPVYVDCNAVNPYTVERIAGIIKPANCPFVDAGIIGGPPKTGYDGPTFYLSGEGADAVAVLNRFGLPCKVLDGPIGAASALKMSYAGITKGLTALAGVMILGATRHGMAEQLRAELAHSQPQLLAWFERQVPSMFPKAYRWVAEMEEIAGFLGDDAAGNAMFQASAGLYERLAADFASAKTETELLTRFFRDR